MPPVDADARRTLALAAGRGDRDVLDQVVSAVQDDIYRLALHMLWHPEDAQDATQEALVKLVTRVA